MISNKDKLKCMLKGMIIVAILPAIIGIIGITLGMIL